MALATAIADERGVGLPVSASVESVSARLAGGCFDRADAAERGEGSLAGVPSGVVADGKEQRGAGVWVDAVSLQQLWSMSLDCGGDLGVEFVDLAGQCRVRRASSRRVHAAAPAGSLGSVTRKSICWVLNAGLHLDKIGHNERGIPLLHRAH